MGLLHFDFRSEELDHYVGVTIAFPTDSYSYKEPEANHLGMKAPGRYTPGMKLQTVYLLHGGGDDDTLTYRYTNVERYAQRNNCMLVTPDIANSFGVDTLYEVHYQSFVAKELPVVIQSLFASSPKREDNFIAGYAMGANAALGIALTYPEQYAMCVDISGGIGLTLSTQTLSDELDGDHFRKFMPLYNTTFGEGKDIPGSKFDLHAIVEKGLKENLTFPKLIICCGEKEFIKERVEEDVRILKELGLDVRYICPEGYAHDFDMWDEHLKLMLDEWLPLKRFN